MFKRSHKKRKLLVMAGMMLFMAGAMKTTTMTAFAAEVTNGNQAAITQQQQTQIVTYNQADAKTLGVWEQQQDGSTWKYRKTDGTYLTNAWVEDASRTGVYYFLDTDGNMLRSSTTPDGYYVDANGEWSLTATNSTADSKSNSGNSTDNNNNGGFVLSKPQENGGVVIDPNYGDITFDNETSNNSSSQSNNTEKAQHTGGSEDANSSGGSEELTGVDKIFGSKSGKGVTIDQNDVARIAQNGNINGMPQ